MAETLICLIDHSYCDMPRGGYRPGSGRKPGYTSPNKGKTWDEIYGVERAKEITEKYTQSIKKHYEKNAAWNKGKKLTAEELETFPLKDHMFKKGQTAWNKGLIGIHSKEGLKSIGNIWRGKHLSDEHRKNISKALNRPETRQKMRDSHLGQKGHWKGKTFSDEHRKNISSGKKGKPLNLSPEERGRRRKQRMSQVFPRENSSLEKMVFKELDKKSVDYDKHYSINGQPDIVFEDERLAVFLDGCYWHACRKCGFDGPASRPESRDKEVTASLESQGWTVLRIWEHDVVNNPEGIVDEMLRKRKGGVSDG